MIKGQMWVKKGQVNDWYATHSNNKTSKRTASPEPRCFAPSLPIVLYPRSMLVTLRFTCNASHTIHHIVRCFEGGYRGVMCRYRGTFNRQPEMSKVKG